MCRQRKRVRRSGRRCGPRANKNGRFIACNFNTHSRCLIHSLCFAAMPESGELVRRDKQRRNLPSTWIRFSVASEARSRPGTRSSIAKTRTILFGKRTQSLFGNKEKSFCSFSKSHFFVCRNASLMIKFSLSPLLFTPLPLLSLRVFIQDGSLRARLPSYVERYRTRFDFLDLGPNHRSRRRRHSSLLAISITLPLRFLPLRISFQPSFKFIPSTFSR